MMAAGPGEIGGARLAEKLADIYLTGSSSRLLSSEFATLLTGRYVQIPMFTLGFKEFLQFRGRQAGEADEQEFELYLCFRQLWQHYQRQEDRRLPEIPAA
ncbi:MAG: AAA family ATPase [Desulfurivibrio sp.]